MPSAICFNFFQSKILSSGNGLKDKFHFFFFWSYLTLPLVMSNWTSFGDGIDQDQPAQTMQPNPESTISASQLYSLTKFSFKGIETIL